jgi:drug/metabolite transporter (DMT)-like permease
MPADIGKAKLGFWPGFANVPGNFFRKADRPFTFFPFMPMFKEHLQLHFIVLLWGFTAIIGKEISLGALELVFFRTLLAGVGFGALVLLMRRAGQWPSRRVQWQFVGNGVLVALHWITFFGAARVSNISICLVGLATVTLFTAFLEPLIMGTRLKWFEIMLGLAAVAGLYTIVQAEGEHLLGLGISLLSALLAATFSVINKHFSQYRMPLKVSFLEMVGAWACTALAVAALAGLSDEPLNMVPTPADWGWLLVLALACTVYAFYYSIKLLEKLSAFYVNLTVNLEPVYGICLALLIYGESEEMTPGFYWGAGIILLSVLVYPLLDRRFGPKPIPVPAEPAA